MVYICPIGSREGMSNFFFWKGVFVKHPTSGWPWHLITIQCQCSSLVSSKFWEAVKKRIYASVWGKGEGEGCYQFATNLLVSLLFISAKCTDLNPGLAGILSMKMRSTRVTVATREDTATMNTALKRFPFLVLLFLLFAQFVNGYNDAGVKMGWAFEEVSGACSGFKMPCPPAGDHLQ